MTDNTLPPDPIRAAREEFADPAVRPASTKAPGERPGDLVGCYKLLEQIGEGGMGTIWMAEQREPVKRRVALKIIKLGMDTKQVIARFEAERQALAMMDHPHIAKVFDAGATEAGRPYFVMEYIKGIPMLEYCDKEKVDTKTRLELFTAVCHAIQHAHQKGIIHRDIKPSNVLVTLHDGVPVCKVIDFGIAKATNSELTTKTLFTEHRQMVGTPAYMSPEQAELSGLDIDTRSDIYSLGVLLYELLTGTTPFDIKDLMAKGFAEMMRTIREVEPHKPSTRISTLGETGTRTALERRIDLKKLSTLLRGDLDWIVMKCLEKDRSRRYETANGLAADIKRHLNDEPVTAGAPSAGYRLRKFAKRNKVQVLAGGAVAAALLIGVVAFAWQAKIADEQRIVAENARVSETEQRKLADASKTEAQAQAQIAKEQEAEAKKSAVEARAQEAEAKKQAAIAEAIAKFQTEMLAAADPQKLLGDTVTVVQVMDAAVGLLDGGSLEDQPLVEAGVRNTIGTTLLGLGRFEDAEPNLRKSLAIHRAELPAGHAAIATSLNDVAVLHSEQGDLAEAESLHREALELRRAALPGDPVIAMSLSNLAEVLSNMGRQAEAETLLREAVDIMRAAHPTGHPNIAGAVQNLGVQLLWLNRLAEAEPLIREALTISRDGLPAGHPHIATCLLNLAALLEKQKRLAEAEPLIGEAVAICRQALPAAHPQIASALLAQGQLLRRMNRLAEAEQCCREALRITRASRPAGHPQIALALNNLATVLKSQNNHAEAAPLYREALEIWRATRPPGHPGLTNGLSSLASELQVLGSLEEAERLFREALTMRRTHLPAEHRDTATNLRELAAVLLLRNKIVAAEPLAREALQMARATHPAGDPLVAGYLIDLGELLRTENRFAEAEPLFREALEILRGAGTTELDGVAAVLGNFGQHLRDQNRLAEAEPLFREALEIDRANWPAGHPNLAVSLRNLGGLRFAQKMHKEAEPLLREALEIDRATNPAGHPAIGMTLGWLGLVLDAQGKFTEAETIYREALAINRAAFPGQLQLADCLNNFARILEGQNRTAEAESFYREELEILSAILPAGHNRLLTTKSKVADLCVRLGKTAEAVLLLRDLLESTRASLLKDSPELAGQLAALSMTMLTLKEWGEAEALLRECLTTREKTQPDAWTTFNTRSMLGAALLGQENFAEAAPLLLDGYRGMKEREASIPPQGATRIPEAIERLVQLYEGLGNAAEADVWRARLGSQKQGSSK